MKKFITLLVVGLALPAVLLASTADAAEKVLRIPFMTNFTGPSSPFSLRLWRGGEMAMKDINAAGGVHGGYKLEFYKVDTRSETQTALTEYRRACRDPSIPMFWANVGSKDVNALYAVSKDCNMATFATSSGAHWVHPDQGKWMFRYLPVPALVQPVLFKKLKEKFNVKRVAMGVEIDNDFAVFNAKSARKFLEELDMEIVVNVDSKMHETNFSAQVAAIRGARADLVILSHNSDAGGRFARQIRERGIDTQISDTGYTIGSRDFWNNSKGMGIGAITSSIYNPTDPRPIVQEWVKRWRAETGKDQDPDPYETSTYDAVKVLAKILDNAKSLDRKDIADAFLTIKNVETISGTVSFRPQDLPDIYRSEPILVQIGENGSLVPWPKMATN